MISICGRHASQGTDHIFSREWTIDMSPRVRSGFESTEWIRNSEPQVGEKICMGRITGRGGPGRCSIVPSGLDRLKAGGAY